MREILTTVRSNSPQGIGAAWHALPGGVGEGGSIVTHPQASHALYSPGGMWSPSHPLTGLVGEQWRMFILGTKGVSLKAEIKTIPKSMCDLNLYLHHIVNVNRFGLMAAKTMWNAFQCQINDTDGCWLRFTDILLIIIAFCRNVALLTMFSFPSGEHYRYYQNQSRADKVMGWYFT